MDVMRRYKFHLAFENSKSIDYVTEKFFQTLEVGMYIAHFSFHQDSDNFYQLPSVDILSRCYYD